MTRTLVVDARALWKSGIGRYTREMTSRLVRRERFAKVILAGDTRELDAWRADEGITALTSTVEVKGGRYSLASQRDWTRLAPTLPRGAIVWFPHWDAPVFYSGPPTVVTVHDLIHLRVASAATPLERLAMRALVRVVTRRARRVVTDAAFTRDDLLSIEPSLAGRIDVVPAGVSSLFLASPADVDALPKGVLAPYLLAVANRKLHKNLVAAVEVLARLRADRPTLTLVVGGEHFPEWAQVLARAEALGVRDAIVDLPHLSDAALAALYRGAECLLFPSRYEGFGLPVLEAMACGAPVVAANTTSIPEVVGDAALLFAPDDVNGMADAVRRLRTDSELRKQLIDAGRSRAAAFTWDKAAERLERVLIEVAS
jgi:glycosyltransferase involved in cell wall biosynthesis